MDDRAMTRFADSQNCKLTKQAPIKIKPDTRNSSALER